MRSNSWRLTVSSAPRLTSRPRPDGLRECGASAPRRISSPSNGPAISSRQRCCADSSPSTTTRPDPSARGGTTSAEAKNPGDQLRVPRVVSGAQAYAQQPMLGLLDLEIFPAAPRTGAAGQEVISELA